MRRISRTLIGFTLVGGLLCGMLASHPGTSQAKPAAPFAAPIDTNIEAYVCAKLDDFQATMQVVSVDARELSKISKDAASINQVLERLGNVKMRYKEPNMVRIEGTKEGTKATYIINGTVQYAGLNGVKTKRNFGNEPGKRKSLMDVGLISEYYLTYTNAKFLREGTVEGKPVAIFEMRYKPQFNDTSHHVVYIDPKTKVVLKRDSYTQEGKLQAVYLYKNVQQVAPGIWFPTRIEAKNTDNVVAGVTGYRDIKVNVGIADSVFQL